MSNVPENLKGLVKSWPFHPRYGVGVRMSLEIGTAVTVNCLAMLFERFGCPEELSGKYAHELLNTDELTVTLTATLNFKGLRECLKHRGIAMTIIPPKGMQWPTS
jgi:hypothetical protein